MSLSYPFCFSPSFPVTQCCQWIGIPESIYLSVCQPVIIRQQCVLYRCVRAFSQGLVWISWKESNSWGILEQAKNIYYTSDEELLLSFLSEDLEQRPPSTDIRALCQSFALRRSFMQGSKLQEGSSSIRASDYNPIIVECSEIWSIIKSIHELCISKWHNMRLLKVLTR